MLEPKQATAPYCVSACDLSSDRTCPYCEDDIRPGQMAVDVDDWTSAHLDCIDAAVEEFRANLTTD